jgi:hypothetical protein
MNATRGPIAWLTRAVRVSRALGFTALVALACSVLYVRNVHASATDQAVALGRELAPFGDVLSGAHRVIINGETLYVATAVSEESIHGLLDRFEAYCDAHNGGVPEDFAARAPEKAAELRRELGDDWLAHWGVLREEHEDEGTVMCIAQRDTGGFAGLMRTLEAFMEDWDLHRVGDFRYVYARRVEGNRTQVFTSLTDGPFHLRRVLPDPGEGDAPGGDPPDAPRPPRSRRLLTSSVDGAPYGLQVFTSAATVDEVATFYERELPGDGWRKIVGNREIGAQAWQRDGVTMIVGAGRAEGDDETKVTFVEGRTVAASALGEAAP